MVRGRVERRIQGKFGLCVNPTLRQYERLGIGCTVKNATELRVGLDCLTLILPARDLAVAYTQSGRTVRISRCSTAECKARAGDPFASLQQRSFDFAFIVRAHGPGIRIGCAHEADERVD